MKLEKALSLYSECAQISDRHLIGEGPLRAETRKRYNREDSFHMMLVCSEVWRRLAQEYVVEFVSNKESYGDPDYWHRMRDEGFWVDGKGWTDKMFKEMCK